MLRPVFLGQFSGYLRELSGKIITGNIIGSLQHGPVSYTHLDVYKRQLHDLVKPCQPVPDSGKLGFAVLRALGRFISSDHVV